MPREIPRIARITDDELEEKAKRKCKGVSVIGVKQRRSGGKHYVYELAVTTVGGAEYTIYRRYSRFDSLQAVIDKLVAAGRYSKLPPKKVLGRSHVRDVAEERLGGIQTFLRSVMSIDKVMSSKAFLEFFEQEADDFVNDFIEKEAEPVRPAPARAPPPTKAAPALKPPTATLSSSATKVVAAKKQSSASPFSKSPPTGGIALPLGKVAAAARDGTTARIALVPNVKRASDPAASIIAIPSDSGKSVDDWSPVDVAAWLTDIGLGKLAPLFCGNDVAGDMLADIDSDVLEEDLGMTSKLDRIKFFKARDKLFASVAAGAVPMLGGQGTTPPAVATVSAPSKKITASTPVASPPVKPPPPALQTPVRSTSYEVAASPLPGSKVNAPDLGVGSAELSAQLPANSPSSTSAGAVRSAPNQASILPISGVKEQAAKLNAGAATLSAKLRSSSVSKPKPPPLDSPGGPLNKKSYDGSGSSAKVALQPQRSLSMGTKSKMPVGAKPVLPSKPVLAKKPSGVVSALDTKSNTSAISSNLVRERLATFGDGNTSSAATARFPIKCEYNGEIKSIELAAATIKAARYDATRAAVDKLFPGSPKILNYRDDVGDLIVIMDQEDLDLYAIERPTATEIKFELSDPGDFSRYRTAY